MPSPTLLQRLKERKLVQWGGPSRHLTKPPATREAFYEWPLEEQRKSEPLCLTTCISIIAPSLAAGY